MPAGAEELYVMLRVYAVYKAYTLTHELYLSISISYQDYKKHLRSMLCG